MRRSAAALAALVVVAAGCGGGGGTRLSRDEYVAKADAICRGVATKRRALPVPSPIRDIPAYVDGALPLLDGERSELRALRPPPQLDEQVSAWLDSIGDERTALSDLRSAARGGDVAKVRAAGSKSAGIGARARREARAIGLVDCANT